MNLQNALQHTHIYTQTNITKDDDSVEQQFLQKITMKATNMKKTYNIFVGNTKKDINDDSITTTCNTFTHTHTLIQMFQMKHEPTTTTTSKRWIQYRNIGVITNLF